MLAIVILACMSEGAIEACQRVQIERPRQIVGATPNMARDQLLWCVGAARGIVAEWEHGHKPWRVRAYFCDFAGEAS